MSGAGTVQGNDSESRLKIAIFIVSYNAVRKLSSVLDRIPAAVWERVEEVFVFDDSSDDDTYLVGLGYKSLHGREKLKVFRNERNLGYGGNQKRGYRYAIERGFDIVALLHGDGQYAPESLPELLAPLERGEADAVFGSRMMVAGASLKGGMPFYKYVGNRVLTAFENYALGTTLSEFHSGYRIYSCAALKQVPFERNTDDFHFDTQIIIQFHAAGLRIVEKPIPTFYGDEICYVNGMKYARDVFRSVVHFKMHELGLQGRPEYQVRPPYTMKQSPFASHNRIVELVGSPQRSVLHVGCGTGEIAHVLSQRGHQVVAAGSTPPAFELGEFVEFDPAKPLPLAEGQCFDVVIVTDTLEHVAEPRLVLGRLIQHLADSGTLIIALPNAVHWSVRAQVARGHFEYSNRGILDQTHLRFFTRQSARRLIEDSGLAVSAHETTPIPWEHVLPAAKRSHLLRNIEKADYYLGRRYPELFAYEHIFCAIRNDGGCR